MSILRIIKKLLRKVKLFVFPERCPYCRTLIEDGKIACDNCIKKIEQIRKPMMRGAMGYRCISSFAYGGRVRRVVLSIKYHERIQFIPQLAEIMAKDIRTVYRDRCFDYISCVPMHPKDERKRGYNQSQLLSRKLSQLLNIPYLDALEKVKHTKKQQQCTYKERKTNPSGAFRVIDKESIKGKSILMIDDIVTSGATLGYCCRELNKAIPSVICCATIANASHMIDEQAII